MTVTEAERHNLRTELGAVMGEGAVATLMDSLPPMDWRELATKTDLAALEERMNTKFDALRVEMCAGFTAVDAKFTEMDAKFTAVHAKFKTVEARITDLGGEMKNDVAKLTRGMARQTYVLLAGVAAIAAPFYFPLFMAMFSGGSGGAG
jgi:hypothetical protein